MKNLILVLFIIPLLFAFVAAHKRSIHKKGSQSGRYQGCTKAFTDGYTRSSKYLIIDDGTRLAYNLYLPTKDGSQTAEALPTLFKYTSYLRTFTIFDADSNFLLDELYDLAWYDKAILRLRSKFSDQGHLMDAVFNTEWLKTLLEHGYAVIVVERPGTGASFGVMDPYFEVGADQADEILDWIAAQDCCDGNIGMYGEWNCLS